MRNTKNVSAALCVALLAGAAAGQDLIKNSELGGNGIPPLAQFPNVGSQDRAGSGVSPTVTQVPVDFVIVGSGSAGGILARELSTKGFDVVVLEQGPFRQAADFTHDEIDVVFGGELLGGPAPLAGQTFRRDESEVAEPAPFRQPAEYAKTVGGSSVHFSGNYWRFREVDFREKSLLGPIAGTNFADWPIDYAELEPYYTRVDWEIGVSGAPGPFDSPRSKPFPLPPMPAEHPGSAPTGTREPSRSASRSARPSPALRAPRGPGGRPGPPPPPAPRLRGAGPPFSVPPPPRRR